MLQTKYDHYWIIYINKYMQQHIEEIAKDIMVGLYGTQQHAGTEWQKWTFALLQAQKIYDEELLIDTNHTPTI